MFAAGLGSAKFILIIRVYRNPVRTSQETRYFTATKPNWLMLFRGTVAVYCENQMEHTNTLYGQNAEFLDVKAGGTGFAMWEFLPGVSQEIRVVFLILIKIKLESVKGGKLLQLFCDMKSNSDLKSKSKKAMSISSS
jgi:hypothetical protein